MRKESLRKKLLNSHPRSSRNSEEWLQDLPSELIPSIVNKLPLKSLCRFKCVSKTWLSMIIHESIREKMQEKRRPIIGTAKVPNKVRRIYSVDGTTGIATHVCDFKDRSLIWNFRGLFYFHKSEGLGVMNPLTQRTVVLPTKTLDKYFVAFGFDPLSNNYKVVTWRYEAKYCEIYTFGDQSWKEITSTTPPPECRELPVRSACIQGTIYWYIIETNMIVSFNLGDEKFRLVDGPKIVAPDPGLGENQFVDVFEFEGCVCLADRHAYCGNYLLTLYIWMLTNDCSTWVLAASITSPSESVKCMLPYSTRTGEVVVGRKKYDSGIVLYLYSFITQQFETLKLSGVASNFLVTNYTPNAVILEDL